MQSKQNHDGTCYQTGYAGMLPHCRTECTGERAKQQKNSGESGHESKRVFQCAAFAAGRFLPGEE